MEFLETVKELSDQLSILQIGVGAAVFLFLLIWLRLILKKPPAHLSAFSSEAGSVLVSRKALQELIRSACLLESTVEAARPVLSVKHNRVTARVELRIRRADNFKATCERVQEHVTTLLQKSLSFDQIGQIEIIVKSFSNQSEAPPTFPAQDSSLLGTSREQQNPPTASQ